MDNSTLVSVIRPVSIETFLHKYFGKTPLLIRGSPKKFDALMKPGDFIRRLDRVREIRCVFKGLKQATISPADIREMFEAGATICVTGIDQAHSSLRVACRQIEREIGYAGRVDFRAYLSPPGSGFDVHYDARIATTLQLEGEKTWWYSEEPALPFPGENSPRFDMALIRRKVARLKFRRVTLKPGDLLCLPPGVWHRARAGAGGSLALNLAFNHAGATVLDVVLQKLRETLESTAGCREPYCWGLRKDPANHLAAHVSQCVEAAIGVLWSMRSAAGHRRLRRTR